MQQGKKLTGKQLGFLTETCSQAQAYLGIPQTFFGSSRQSTTKIEDAAHTKKMLTGTSGKRCAGERKKRQRMAFEAPFVPPV